MFACNFVKSMQLVFFFYFVRSYAQRIRLLPDVAEQVIDAGSNITLICIFEDLKFYSKISAVAPLSWELPDYIVKYPEESFVANRLVKTFDTNETHKISSLTLAQATTKDTGYFGCTGRLLRVYDETLETKQYVYVYRNDSLAFIDDPSQGGRKGYHFTFRQGNSGLVPCKSTHQNVTVTIKSGILTVL
ncbi:uncharacterized protein LOC124209635 [Daphnia pulex]|uniref:uncharacterized protein LOC124209635 n=1 Tax=Daphnia pulex TaxID=6669 RepID=UPI001EDFFB4D|nr:uncharacterized protein LOC124209635 [Daphnia pulex]